MAEAALILSSPAAAQPARAIKPVQDNGSTEGDAARSGFSDLLEAIEQVAAEGQQVEFVELDVPPLTTPVPQVLSQAQTGSEQLLSTVVQKLGALAANGENPRQRVSPFSEIRPILTPGASTEQHSQGAELQAYMTRAQGQLTPSQLATLTAVEEVQAQAQQQNPADLAAAKLETQVAATPRLEASLTQAASGETSNPVVRQVATNLQYVARGEMERMRIDLHPEELGRVQVQLQKSGAVTRVLVVTETAQAFEALKAGAGGLQQSLSQAGFDADEVRFETREDREQGRHAEADERQERRQGRDAGEEREERRELVISHYEFTGRTVLL
ncbi:MAG: flagellar hook-length control protein FliK [Parvularculaceae bacterium]|nr:flagellar hook-length control protein FliK [Parvularculaceae bacterium]